MNTDEEQSSCDRKQLSKELHSNIIKRFPRRRIMVPHLDHTFAADLVIMPLEREYKYILTVIDIFSKFSWAIPLKSKTGIEITEAFQKIFKESRRKPKKLFTDKGT